MRDARRGTPASRGGVPDAGAVRDEPPILRKNDGLDLNHAEFLSKLVERRGRLAADSLFLLKQLVFYQEPN